MPITQDEVKLYNETANRYASVSNTEQFDAQIQTVTQERKEVYGAAHVNFERMSIVDELVRTCPDPRIRSALRMVGYKICRMVQSPNHLDSAVDIAGYARVITEIQEFNKLRDPRKEE